MRFPVLNSANVELLLTTKFFTTFPDFTSLSNVDLLHRFDDVLARLRREIHHQLQPVSVSQAALFFGISLDFRNSVNESFILMLLAYIN